ncbi:hypothetical protein BABINDRAFT_160027 [Babjeviella inositovora NRRL Y-12698]|uniref:Uncharacterized protein n=1 Tax=Babjeviella inositovora NRRL Y-12698 TaxID=984486 RepID=A0A1E3QXM2_9ASCO|nr:uncharacterized protein BABINDRAFT_160027 [Babjeviella inositovora NRRL Y-12698]ODQ81787.1 hypothetical protein BABINDRAFT_160027 [Babjeviella inositovora NRRL Y-12698]
METGRFPSLSCQGAREQQLHGVFDVGIWRTPLLSSPLTPHISTLNAASPAIVLTTPRMPLPSVSNIEKTK